MEILLLVALYTLGVLGVPRVQYEHALVLNDLENVAHVRSHGLANAGPRDKLLVAFVLQFSRHDTKVLLVVGTHTGIVQLLSFVLEDGGLAHGKNLHRTQGHL